ncbi:MAG TPA: hypothetical protein VH092_31780 [Urbifossiella sp.]|nr:hypothetical protein [Urbifossiella sp.]
MAGSLKPKRGRKGRRPRGEGAVFFSDSKQCWVWRAVVGTKPDGSVQYTEGRARTPADGVEKKRAAERANRRPNTDQQTTGEYLSYWLTDIDKLYYT